MTGWRIYIEAEQRLGIMIIVYSWCRAHGRLHLRFVKLVDFFKQDCLEDLQRPGRGWE
jgi:hypothetical protein